MSIIDYQLSYIRVDAGLKSIPSISLPLSISVYSVVAVVLYYGPRKMHVFWTQLKIFSRRLGVPDGLSLISMNSCLTLLTYFSRWPGGIFIFTFRIVNVKVPGQRLSTQC